MNKCEMIRDLLPLYVDNLCSEETKLLVEDHLEQCPECRKALDNMISEIPSLKIEPPSSEQLSPFKKIKKQNQIRTLLIILASLIIFSVTTILISQKIIYRNSRTINCKANFAAVFKSINELFSDSDNSPELYIVLSNKNGYLLDKTNFNFVIYNKTENRYYQIEHEKSVVSNDLSLHLLPLRGRNLGDTVYSITNLIELLNYISDDRQLDLAEFALNINSCNNKPRGSFSYYYDGYDSSFIDATKISEYTNSDYQFAYVSLVKAKTAQPQEGFLSGNDLLVIDAVVAEKRETKDISRLTSSTGSVSSNYTTQIHANTRIFYKDSNPVASIREEYEVLYYGKSEIHFHSCTFLKSTVLDYDSSDFIFGSISNTDGSVSYLKGTGFVVNGPSYSKQYDIDFIVTNTNSIFQ